MRRRIALIALLAISATTGVASSPTCRTFAVQVAKRVHHSAVTLLAWKDWNKKHPKQAAAMERRRKSIVETLEMMTACEEQKPIVPELEALVPDEPGIEAPVFEAEMAPAYPSNPVPITTDETAACADCDSTWPYGGSPIFFGGGSGSTPPPPLPSVPEPSTWVLVASGITFMLVVVRRNRWIN